METQEALYTADGNGKASITVESSLATPQKLNVESPHDLFSDLELKIGAHMSTGTVQRDYGGSTHKNQKVERLIAIQISG